MSDDLLKDAVRALRESTEDGGGDDAGDLARSRSQILRTLHRERTTSSVRVAFLLPIAAVLAGGTALAAASGRLPELVERAASALGITPAEPSAAGVSKAAGRGAAPGVPAQPAPAPAAEPVPEAEPAPAEPAPPALEPPPLAVAPPEPLAAAPSVAEPAPSVAAAPARSGTGAAPAAPSGSLEPAADALYRRAHEAHFGRKQPAEALALWDEYLAAAPRGRFALEASYNRALCLVRLGRRAEARAALEPFAQGRFGSYRQEEARALVGALGGE